MKQDRDFFDREKINGERQHVEREPGVSEGRRKSMDLHYSRIELESNEYFRAFRKRLDEALLMSLDVPLVDDGLEQWHGRMKAFREIGQGLDADLVRAVEATNVRD